jgi:hypothetical protein
MLPMLIELLNRGRDQQAKGIDWWMPMGDFWISWIHKNRST